MRHCLLPFLLFAVVWACAEQCQAEPAVQARLLSDTSAAIPGKQFTAGVLLEMRPQWHTYWQNPGDSGMATTVHWELPDGVKAGEIQWPVPTLTQEDGGLITYTYKEEVLLLVPVTVSAGYVGQSVHLKAKVRWLACEKLCEPGEADVALVLPVAASATPENQKLFDKYKRLVPDEIRNSGLQINAQVLGKTVNVEVKNLPHGETADLYPILNGTETYTHVAEEKVGGNGRQFSYSLEAGHFNGVAAVLAVGEKENRRGWLIRPEVAPGGSAQGRSHWMFFLFAFLGGLILNVMPCVLPVIALKIMGFVHQAGETPKRVFRLGLAFVAGIFAWFLGLATFLVSMKAAGHQVNWAFQFQNPAFVLFMFIIVLVFALNLLGAFELVLPAKVNTKLSKWVAHEGYRGAFMHGVFATLLATPCTAPFLAPALGFALGQPAVMVFSMFATIAAGMSLPYFLLTVRPAWLRYLPKPGLWMVRLKQLMGVLLLGTAIWLGWVYYRQATPKPAQMFSRQLEDALRSDNVVFIDFTADWCVNCKVNERLVLDSQAVQQVFMENKVTFLKADWTRGDPEITALLKRFGRAGVPLYVIYPKADRENPRVLPELLTRDMVIKAVEEASKP